MQTTRCPNTERIGCYSRLLILTLIAFASGSCAKGAAAMADYTIAFASFAPLNDDIFIADAAGSNPKPLLPHPDQDYNGSFSHDGNWVVFTSERDGSADIYRAHPNGSGLEKLIGGPAFDDQAAVSPDGRYLAFVSTRGGHANIWRLDMKTKELRNLTPGSSGDFRPAWSPDGNWIAYRDPRRHRVHNNIQRGSKQ
jgi:TolB protein